VTEHLESAGSEGREVSRASPEILAYLGSKVTRVIRVHQELRVTWAIVASKVFLGSKVTQVSRVFLGSKVTQARKERLVLKACPACKDQPARLVLLVS